MTEYSPEEHSKSVLLKTNERRFRLGGGLHLLARTPLIRPTEGVRIPNAGDRTHL